jgi:hypothetical protein
MNILYVIYFLTGINLFAMKELDFEKSLANSRTFCGILQNSFNRPNSHPEPLSQPKPTEQNAATSYNFSRSQIAEKLNPYLSSTGLNTAKLFKQYEIEKQGYTAFHPQDNFFSDEEIKDLISDLSRFVKFPNRNDPHSDCHQHQEGIFLTYENGHYKSYQAYIPSHQIFIDRIANLIPASLHQQRDMEINLVYRDCFKNIFESKNNKKLKPFHFSPLSWHQDYFGFSGKGHYDMLFVFTLELNQIEPHNLLIGSYKKDQLICANEKDSWEPPKGLWGNNWNSVKVKAIIPCEKKAGYFIDQTFKDPEGNAIVHSRSEIDFCWDGKEENIPRRLMYFYRVRFIDPEVKF